MKTDRKSWLPGLLIALAASLPGAALPSKLADTLSGTVTSVIGHEIVIDGRSYEVMRSPGTDRALLTLRSGDLVKVTLNAPPAKKGALVTSITVQTSTGE